MDKKHMMELNKNNIEDILPLTPLQAGMLYHDLLEKESQHHVSYNQQVRFRLTGKLDIGAFRQAWQHLIDRHAALRVVFKHDKSAEPIQIVLKERDFVVRFVDLTALSDSEKAQRLEGFIESDKRKTFALERDIPMRVSLLKSEPDVHWFIWSFHHICLDGWCVASLQQELFTVYQQLIQGEAIDLPPAPSFSRYIKWYKSQESHQDFWHQYLAGYSQTVSPPLPTLRHDGQRSDASSCHDYGSESRLIDGLLWDKLNQLSAETGATLSTLFHCLWGLFLAKVNDTEDVVFGSVQSIRPLANSRFERLIGLCINTIPYRIHFSEQDCLTDIARCSQLNQLDCLEHATMSVSDIQALCSQTGKLFDHFIAFENYPATDSEACGKEKLTDGLYADEFREYMPTSYPFHLAVLPTKQSLQILFKYVPRKVDKENIRAIADTFVRFADICLSAADRPVADIVLSVDQDHFTSAEPEKGKTTGLPATTLINLYRQQLQQTDTIAIVEGTHCLTHQQLFRASLMLAHQIQDRLNGEAVALYDTAGTEMLVAMFACFHLGVPYVPLDPANPLTMSASILKTANVGLIITAHQQTELLTQGTGIECLTIEPSFILTAGTESPLSCQPDGNSIAYIIFTSGTTGEPKGVPVTQQALINYIGWCQDRFNFSASDRSLLLTSFHFDLGYTAIFGTLLSGGTLYVASEAQRRDPHWVAACIKENHISFLKLTPSYLHMLTEILGTAVFENTSLRRLIMGGEPLNYGDLRSIHHACPQLDLFNHYGPTENTIGCCAHKISNRDLSGQYQNIGRPAHNTEAYILNRQRNLCPPYIEGELCLAGAQLFRAYLNSDNHHHLINYQNKPVYRTGDRAYRTESGDIIFIGREQQSVKIDGYRVSLNAVQQVILTYPAIKDCLVDSFKRDDGSMIIVALIIPAEDTEVRLHQLRNWLGEQLPHYMHPSDFIEVSRFPITTNGKLDRKTLFSFWKNRLNTTSGESYQSPQTETEVKLVSIWEKIFLKQQISTTTSFFALGGHSIKAIICTSEIRKHFGVTLPIAQIFTHPTIAELAQVIDRYQSEENTGHQISASLITNAYQRILPLYSGGQRKNDCVYCLPAILGTSTVYKEILEALQMPLQAFGFQCGGFVTDPLPDDMSKLADLAAQCIAEHYDAIQNKSRMLLLGYSFGAVLAVEVARRLEKWGYATALLLIDSNLNAQERGIEQTFRQMRHIQYWNRIISLFEQNLNEAELNQIEQGVLHNQRILQYHLQHQKADEKSLNSEMICIESNESSDHGYMQCFGQKTTGQCRIISTSGDHYSMFQPPHFTGLISNIRDAIGLLWHQEYAKAELN